MIKGVKFVIALHTPASLMYLLYMVALFCVSENEKFHFEEKLIQQLFRYKQMPTEI